MPDINHFGNLHYWLFSTLLLGTYFHANDYCISSYNCIYNIQSAYLMYLTESY